MDLLKLAYPEFELDIFDGIAFSALFRGQSFLTEHKKFIGEKWQLHGEATAREDRLLAQ